MEKNNTENSSSPETGYSRRDFLKIVGAATGTAAVGCAQRPVEKIIPYVNQPDEVIPGVATWYAGSCGECDAGCGVLVRTREGRAVKLEGNPEHPVNGGGLCARGQASLQGMYDPDRIREPLKRDINGAFKPVTWDEALSAIKAAYEDISEDEEAVFLTRHYSGSTKALMEEFARRAPKKTRHVTYELLGRDVLDRAAELSFGPGTRVNLDFSKADVIASFGAGFLETWVSPVEFSKQWASRRSPEKGHVNYLIHFEPRLSLTASNADRWVMNAPGTEAELLAGLLKSVLENGGSSRLDGAARAQLDVLIQGIDITKIESKAGVPRGSLRKLAKRLLGADSSLVVAGGASVGGTDTLRAYVLANALNATLGNIGKSVHLSHGQGELGGTDHENLSRLAASLAGADGKGGKVGLLCVSGTNPYYSAPISTGFRRAITKAKFVVAISTALDETAAQANIVLPMSTNLESWSDSEPRPGVYNLNQPAMQPLYETQSFGDSLIALAAKLDIRFGKTTNLYDYIRMRMKSQLGETGFEDRWLKLVEHGGDWSRDRFDSQAGGWSFASTIDVAKPSGRKPSENGMTLLAYPTVSFYDGSSANRSWLQELPDPMTTVVWGSWAEMNPKVASSKGLVEGDVLKVSGPHGSVEVPLFLNKHLHPGVVAIPIGQGHEQLGRYADGVGANVLSMLAPDADGGSFQFLGDNIKVATSISQAELVKAQFSDTQLDRGIIRSVNLSDLNGHNGSGHGGGHDSHGSDHGAGSKGHGGGHGGHGGGHGGHGGGHGGHGEVPQMYEQMEHPLHKWGMSIDLAKCTGCSACVSACYAENNIPVVGKELSRQGREMSWIRIERFFDGPSHQPLSGHSPMMCQHCGNAGCEPVCPVYATYHNEEGLNVMVYNRCVGTRYCSNNCGYKVRRFNWFHYKLPEPLDMQLNPDVTVREVGVMEKCSLCIQRIREGENSAKNEGRDVRDGEIQTACASSCPTKAIRFGNLLDEHSEVSENANSSRAYKVLDHHLNSQPALSYLKRVLNDKDDISNA